MKRAKKYSKLTIASVLLETREMLEAIRDVIGFGTDVEIAPYIAKWNGHGKVRYTVEWKTV